MAHHVLDMPITDAQARALKVGDSVTLEKTLFGIRDATLIEMFDRGRTTRFDLKGQAVIHTAPNVRKVDPRPGNSCGYEPLCIGTTTSMRMERFTRPLMQKTGVKLIIGKGGMGPGHARCVQGIRRRLSRRRRRRRGAGDDLDRGHRRCRLEDLHPESLWKFRIKGFGPLLVTMDSHGGSLHAQVNAEAAARRAAVLANIGALRRADARQLTSSFSAPAAPVCSPRCTPRKPIPILTSPSR